MSYVALRTSALHYIPLALLLIVPLIFTGLSFFYLYTLPECLPYRPPEAPGPAFPTKGVIPVCIGIVMIGPLGVYVFEKLGWGSSRGCFSVKRRNEKGPELLQIEKLGGWWTGAAYVTCLSGFFITEFEVQ